MSFLRRYYAHAALRRYALARHMNEGHMAISSADDARYVADAAYVGAIYAMICAMMLRH